MQSRICIVGENGAGKDKLNRIFRMKILIVQYLGKTTLLKIIMEMMDPTKGTRVAHRNLKFGYFTQV